MKRTTLLMAIGISTGCASGAALAHVDVGVYLGAPAPVYIAPPPVVYEAPPVVYAAPPVVYAPAPAAYGYDSEYWERRRWHEYRRYRDWRHHHDDDDEQ
ncbi:MAG: hypothetical protein RXR20_04630 [Paraburkholderia sp.]|jgi:hypothetical protein|uniref:hypothetical protein n=1 Tax=Burkholderiaceae TaxID=119060 RepID=UPI0010F8927E|nr:hypothetical protein [Burkholderia sp. 4M9327F10]